MSAGNKERHRTGELCKQRQRYLGEPQGHSVSRQKCDPRVSPGTCPSVRHWTSSSGERPRGSRRLCSGSQPPCCPRSQNGEGRRAKRSMNDGKLNFLSPCDQRGRVCSNDW
jgi:hypothetical protein